MKLTLLAVIASSCWASLAAAQFPSSTRSAHWGYSSTPQFAPVAPPSSGSEPFASHAPPMFAPQRLTPEPDSPAPGGDRFSLLVFTAQTAVKHPRATHTWAALVRHDGDRVLDVQTISWMPHDLRIKPYDLSVEPGTNLTLADTIGWITTQTPQQVTLWMPLDASPELAARFDRQKNFLDGGAVGYQCLDFIGEAKLRHNGCNCIHAITPLHDRGLGDVAQLYGDASGHYIVEALQRRGLAIPMSGDSARLISTLGLDGVPIRRR